MLSGLNHLTLAVSNLERSFEFYTHLLGLTPRAKWSTGAYLTLGDLWLCLSLDSVDAKRDYTHYAFSVSSRHIGDLTKRLRSAGVSEWKTNTSEGESVYFLDPDGHRLELHCGDLRTRLRACRDKPYDGMIFY